MRFEISGTKKVSDTCASIRIDTGIVSFYVRVEKQGDDYKVTKPNGIFIPKKEDWSNIIGAAIKETKNVISMENEIYGKAEAILR